MIIMGFVEGLKGSHLEKTTRTNYRKRKSIAWERERERERESTITWNVGSGACVQACGLNAASQCFWHSVHAAVCACVLGESICNCFSLFDMQMYSFIHSIIWFRTHQVTDIWQFCNNHLSYFSKQMKQGWYITH